LVLNLNSQNNISYSGGGTSWFDLTGNNNTGTLTNGPTFNTTERSIVFDGADDYVTLGDIMPINTYTKCVVFNISNIGSANNLISGSGGGTHYFYPASSNYLRTGHFQEGAELVSNTPIVANKWYHGVVTFSTSSGFVMYQNGVNVGTNSSKAPFIGGNALFLGSYAASYLLNGKIANAQIYDRALTPTEVLQSYYQGNIVTNGLVLNLDGGNLVSYGGTGTNWYDLTNTTTGGTLTNGPTYTTSNGGSISLDGSDDYVFIAGPNSGPLNTIGTGNFTINVWASNTGSANYRWFLSNWLTTGMHMGMNASSQFGGYFGDNDELRTDYSIPSDGSWHFYTATRTSGTIKYFVDGIERTIILGNPTNKTNSLSSGTDTKIGTRGDATSQQWLGNVAIEQIYNRALSQSEIIQNFNAHKSRYGL
jgi:hypothetical protein